MSVPRKSDPVASSDQVILAVTVEVAGVAYYTGESTFQLEDGDDLGRGFIVR